MGFGSKGPDVTQVNPANPAAQGTSNALGSAFQQFLGQGQGFGQQGLSGQAGNAIASLLGQNPQMQAAQFGMPQGMQTDMGAGGQVGSPGSLGQGLIAALGPLRAQQMQAGQTGLANSASGINGTALAMQGLDLQTQMGTQFAAQDAGILQQAQQTQFDQALQGGQFGLQQQDQLLKLLGLGNQFAGTNPMDTVVQPQGGGFGGFLGQLGGGLLGSVAGPFGATIGANLAGNLFGGGGGGGSSIFGGGGGF